MYKFLLTIVMLTQLIACGNESSVPLNAPDNLGLGAGPHMGMITGFDPLNSRLYNQPARVASLIDEAKASGMNISRYQIEWAELENEPGNYNQTRLDELLQTITANGLPAFITLSTLDTGGFTFPDYLMEGANLRSSLTISSHEVTQALSAFLLWFVPQLSTTDVWGLSIGNEGDTLFEDNRVSPKDFVTFFQTGLERVNKLDPKLSSSVTFTAYGYKYFPNVAQAILAKSDHATVNYYCLDANLQVTRKPAWKQYLQDLKRDVGAKPIFFQELGCPVGYGDDGTGVPARSPSRLNGSPEVQAQFIAYLSDVFIHDPQFIGATWFQLLDWSPELARHYSEPIAQESALAGQLLEEWLATSGLCRWADGSCRKGWEQWLIALAKARDARLAH